MLGGCEYPKIGSEHVSDIVARSSGRKGNLAFIVVKVGVFLFVNVFVECVIDRICRVKKNLVFFGELVIHVLCIYMSFRRV